MTAAPHTPSLAAGGGAATDPRRALILAGGGMRVAYQAGVLVALEEAGLRFAHADGTSGGTMNVGMLMSGVAPREMCERWRTLRLSGFVSPLPLRQYLRGPSWPGFGDGDGIRTKVYPHLGIDVERIHAAEGIDATFNVCNYTRKTNVAVHHRDVDLDLLVAGISLPIFMPATEHGGELYLDSVWIKDANLLEAARRGCDEIWLVWCIGNMGTYRDGAFKQYVHMIEMSANGSLNEELEQIRAINETRERPIRVHVIRPEWPLPLDPDFYMGRIDAATLVALGYRDACRYLEARDESGVPLTPDATRMREPRPGVGWRVALRGQLALGGGGELEVHAAAEVEDARALAQGRPGVAVGAVSHPAIGERVLARDGSVVLQGDRLLWRLELGERSLELEQRVDGLRGAACAQARVRDGGEVVAAAELRGRALPTLLSLHARGVASPLDGARTLGGLARGIASRRGVAHG